MVFRRGVEELGGRPRGLFRFLQASEGMMLLLILTKLVWMTLKGKLTLFDMLAHIIVWNELFSVVMVILSSLAGMN